jgi:hypothetical protein
VTALKRLTALLLTGIIALSILSGCSSNKEKLSLDSKDKALPDYVLNTSDKIKETYIMAATYPQVLASVPCYCGCGTTDGHKSNLDCFVDQFGDDQNVEEWDSMGVS